ncbi:MAG: leucine-rich repeat domain-containing protein [Eubacterium sp.]
MENRRKIKHMALIAAAVAVTSGTVILGTVSTDTAAGKRTVVTAEAAEGNTVQSGSCGKGAVYTLTADGTLRIAPKKGVRSAAMDHYTEKKTPWNDSKVRKIVISSGITSVGASAFKNAYAVRAVSLPDTLKQIEAEAFADADGLTEITVPDRVTSMGPSAFARCDGLRTVRLPQRLRVIPNTAFYACRSLTDVTVSSKLKKIGTYAFADCPSLQGWHTAAGKGTRGVLRLPNTVTSVGGMAFAWDRSFSSAVIPKNTSQIRSNSFYKCSRLRTVRIASGNRKYTSAGGVVFTKDKKTLVLYPAGRKGSYRVPAGTRTIGTAAFRGCSGLTGVKIPNSVTKISADAFRFCGRMRGIRLSSRVKSIGSYALGTTSSGTMNLRFVLAAPAGSAGSRYADAYGLIWKKA